MAKSNKIIFCVFMLINTSLYAENTTNLEEKISSAALFMTYTKPIL